MCVEDIFECGLALHAIQVSIKFYLSEDGAISQ